MNWEKIRQIQEDIYTTSCERDNRLARVEELNNQIEAQRKLVIRSLSEAFPVGSQWLLDICGAMQRVTVVASDKGDWVDWGGNLFVVLVADREGDRTWEHYCDLEPAPPLVFNDTAEVIYVKFDPVTAEGVYSNSEATTSKMTFTR